MAGEASKELELKTTIGELEEIVDLLIGEKEEKEKRMVDLESEISQYKEQIYANMWK